MEENRSQQSEPQNQTHQDTPRVDQQQNAQPAQAEMQTTPPVQENQPVDLQKNTQATQTREFFPYHRIVYGLYSVLEVLFIARVFFDMFAAQSEHAVVMFTHTITDPLVAPFVGIFEPAQLNSGVTLEWSVIIAMVVYGLAATAFARVLKLIRL